MSRTRRPRVPRADLALDPEAVLRMLLAPVRSWRGFEPSRCEIAVLKRNERRIVARYDLWEGHATASVVGKWYSTDRGATVADALDSLRNGALDAPHSVPALLLYEPDGRALFVEWVEGTLLREEIRRDPATAARAGGWLSAFHRSPLRTPRACGPDKQRRAVQRWTDDQPRLEGLAGDLAEALQALPYPGRPVHYDYYHSQVLLAEGRTVAIDLDESGLGDQSFDLAHFDAHLRLLALQWFADPTALSDAAVSFRDGYERGGGRADPPERRPALSAFAWFKLAHQRLRAGAALEADYALEAVRESLSRA